MTNLVYWYGASEDITNAYSFLPTSKLISLENAKKKGIDQVPKAIQKKIDQGKKLSKGDSQLTKGLEEMHLDLKKAPEDRVGYLSPVLEDYEFPPEEEMLPGEPEDLPPKTKRSKKEEQKPKTTKKKKDKKKSEISDTEAAAKPIPKKKGKKKSNGAGGERDRIELDEIDLGSKGLPSDEDKDDEVVMPESGSDDDDDEEEFELDQKKSKAKKKILEAKQLPKKKSAKAKAELDTKSAAKKKKLPSLKARQRAEQQKFEDCESNYLKLIQAWERAVKERDEKKLGKIIPKLITVVENFSAPFIEEYGMAETIKEMKNLAKVKELRLKLREAMSEVYKREKSDVPQDFKPLKQVGLAKEIQIKKEAPTQQSTEAQVTADDAKDVPNAIEIPVNGNFDAKLSGSQDSLAAEALSLDSIVATPIKQEATATHENVEDLQQQTPPVKQEKKKFSLGGLMRTNSKQPKAEAKGNAGNVPSCDQSSRRQKIPDWISEATKSETPFDENRSCALEFLLQATPFIPPSNHVNHDAIARSLEAAIFDWAQNPEDSWIENYWDKVHDIVASISGKREAGTLAKLIGEGRFSTPAELLKLSEDDLLCSFEGRAVVF
jgi:hypothetical protein